MRALSRDGWLPLQHGAWSMTFIPLLVGSLLGGFRPIHLLLLFSWTAAFFFFNVFGLLIKARRRRRYWSATITYGAIAGAGAAILLVLQPGLWVWGPALAVFFLWAIAEILRRSERSLGARLSAIMASCLMMPVAYSLGSHPDDWHALWIKTAVVALYFAGTVPYIKTLIRERGSRGWLIGSLAFHAAVLLCAIVAAVLYPQFLSWTIPFAWAVLLARAAIYPWLSKKRGKPLSPKFIGLSEFGFSALVVAAISF